MAVSTTTSINQSIKRLGLITGDKIIGGTRFEGGFLLENLEFARDLFEQNSKEFSALGFNVTHFLEKLSVFQDPKEEDFTNLTPGESRVIPSGWGGLKSGHAILLEIIKKNESCYTLRIFNRGAGCSRHGSIEEGLKIKRMLAYTIDDIPKKKISQGFLNFIKELMDQKDANGEEAIYEHLVCYLEGKVVSGEPQGKIDFCTPQRSGSCSWKCLIAFIKYYCNDYQTYRKVKHLIWSKVFERVYNELKHLEPSAYLEHKKILEFAIRNFHSSVLKSFELQILNLEERNAYLRKIQEIEKIIPEYQIEIEPALPIEPPADSTASLEPRSSLSPLKPTEIYQPPALFFQKEMTPDSIHEYLDDLIQMLEQPQVGLNPCTIAQKIKKLPMPNEENSCWNQTLQDIKSAILKLGKIAEKTSLSTSSSSLSLTANFHLLAIIDHLRKYSTESHFSKDLVLDTPDFYDIYNFYLSVFDEEEIRYRKKVASYFRSELPRDQKLFFYQDQQFHNKTKSFSAPYLSGELNKTPFERYLKKYFLEHVLKTEQFLEGFKDSGEKSRFFYFLNNLDLYLPPIDLILYNTFRRAIYRLMLIPENGIEEFLKARPIIIEEKYIYPFLPYFKNPQDPLKQPHHSHWSARELHEVKKESPSLDDIIWDDHHSEKALADYTITSYDHLFIGVDPKDIGFRVLDFLANQGETFKDTPFAIAVLFNFLYSDALYDMQEKSEEFTALFQRRMGHLQSQNDQSPLASAIILFAIFKVGLKGRGVDLIQIKTLLKKTLENELNQEFRFIIEVLLALAVDPSRPLSKEELIALLRAKFILSSDLIDLPVESYGSCFLHDDLTKILSLSFDHIQKEIKAGDIQKILGPILTKDLRWKRIANQDLLFQSPFFYFSVNKGLFLVKEGRVNLISFSKIYALLEDAKIPLELFTFAKGLFCTQNPDFQFFLDISDSEEPKLFLKKRGLLLKYQSLKDLSAQVKTLLRRLEGRNRFGGIFLYGNTAFAIYNGGANCYQIDLDEGHIIDVSGKKISEKKYTPSKKRYLLPEDFLEFRPSWFQGEGDEILQFEVGRLFFKKTDKGLESLEHPGFFLCLPLAKLFSGRVSYLHLTNFTTGKHKAFLKSDQRLLELEVDSTFEINTKSNEASFLVAYQFLAHHEYQKAYQFISKAIPIGLFKKKEADIACSILQHPFTHPDALVCKMKILALIYQELRFEDKRSHFFRKKEFLDETLERVYRSYLDLYGKGDLEPISFKEEKAAFLDHSFKDEMLSSRVASLDHERGQSFRSSGLFLSSLPKTLSHIAPTPDELENVAYEAYQGATEINWNKLLSIYRDIQKGNNFDEIDLLALRLQTSEDFKKKGFGMLISRMRRYPNYYRFFNFISLATTLKKELKIIWNVDFEFPFSYTPLFFDKSRYKKESNELLRVLKKREKKSVTSRETLLFINGSVKLRDSPDQPQQKSRMSSHELESEIMSLSSKLPEKDFDALNLRKSGREQAPTLKELLALFILKDINSYLKRTFLTPADALKLHQLIGEYLEASIIENQYQAKEDEAKIKELLDQDYLYNPNAFPELLVFEALSGLRLRQSQLDHLQNLFEQPGCVIKMIMGGGKSSVITPIWAMRKAKEGKLGFIVVPESLYPTAKEVAKEAVYQSFGAFGHGFECSQETLLTRPWLQSLLMNLKRYQKEKGFVYTTKESLQSFYLKTLELFVIHDREEFYDKKDEIKTQITLAFEILGFLKTECVALFDEVHELLDCRHELNFTLGHKLEVNQKYSELILEIVLAIEGCQELGLCENRQAHFKDYTAKIKPLLMTSLREKFPDLPADYYEEGFSGSIESREDRDLVALSKEIIEKMLPSILRKKRNQHYGLRKGVDFAIPYKANETPSIKAQFSSEYETLIFTFIYYLQSGVGLDKTSEVYTHIVKKANEQMRLNHTFLENTLIYKDFLERYRVALNDEEGPKLFHQRVNESSRSKLKFVLDYICPSIKTYSAKLYSNPQDLFHFFESCQAMSGTTWNAQTYPSSMEVKATEEIDQISRDLICKMGPESIFALKKGSDQAVFDQIMECLTKKRYHALIDCGSLIKSIGVKVCAEEILSRLEEFEGVVFYDDQDQLMVLDRSNEIVEFERSPIEKEKRFTFYDQRHTTGSDIKQVAQATALVTFSETTKQYELFQSMWRMRELGRGQNIHLCISEELSLHGAHEILALAASNESDQIKEDNFIARIQEIRGIVIAAILKELIAVEIHKKQALFTHVKELLIQNQNRDPYILFGKASSEKEPHEIFSSYIAYWRGILLELEKKGFLKDVGALCSKMESLKPISLFDRYKTSTTHDMGGTTEVAVLQQQAEQNSAVVGSQSTLREFKKRYVWPVNMSIYEPHFDPCNLFRSKQERESLKNILDEPWFMKIVKTVYRVSMTIFFSSFNFISKIFESLGDKPFQLKVESIRPILAPDALVTKPLSSWLFSKQVFDPQIRISYNFLLPFNVYRMFEGFQKPVIHVLVMQHSDKRVETLLIDQNDLDFFREKITRQEEAKECKISIYDVPNGAFSTEGQEKIDLNDPVIRLHFIKQLVQIKFLGGICEYTDEESLHLKQWLQKDPPYFYELFKKILESTPGEKIRFLNSKAQEIFASLIQEPIVKPRRVTKYFHILRANLTYQIKKAFHRIMGLAFT